VPATLVPVEEDLSARQRIDSAMKAMDRGSLGSALDLLREAEQTARASGNPRTQVVLRMAQGRYAYEMGNAIEALDKLKDALRIDPDLLLAHFYLGLTYVDLNRTNQACAAFARAAELPPPSPNAADAATERRRLHCPAPQSSLPPP
jgi:tetratricopeptide (TPR) repeat protein